jgi:hypothetical protein
MGRNKMAVVDAYLDANSFIPAFQFPKDEQALFFLAAGSLCPQLIILPHKSSSIPVPLFYDNRNWFFQFRLIFVTMLRSKKSAILQIY